MPSIVRPKVHTWLRILVVLAVALAVLPTATPSQAHTEAEPARLTPATRARIVITATPERAPFRNDRLTVVIPRQFEPLTCDGPDGWVCGLNRDAHAPHVLVEWQSVGSAQDNALDFGVTVLVPTQTGAYLLRALQTHADGYVEPWVYNEEPFPSAYVVVGDDTRLVNPDGSSEDPPCYGPSHQPASYEDHDGSELEDGCDPSQPAPGPDERPPPSPSPTSSPTSPASPTPTTGITPTNAPSAEPTSAGSAEPTSSPSEPSQAPTNGLPGTDNQSPEPAETAGSGATTPPAISLEDLDRPRDRESDRPPVTLLVGGLGFLAAIGAVARRELRRSS